MRISISTWAAVFGAGVLGLVSLASTPALATDEADVMAAVALYNKDFSPAFCAPKTIIIDDFPPHAWQGATACKDWTDSFAAYNRKAGISDELVTLDKPWHVTVTGDRAYAVYPTHYSYKQNGKPVTERGVWTLTLEKLAAGWRIAGWAWAQH